MAREYRVGIDTSVCRQDACIVQKAERLLGKQKVDGSIPPVSSNTPCVREVRKVP